jgi:hypothetical protein
MNSRPLDPFPYKAYLSRDRRTIAMYGDMGQFCNNLTDHWGYNHISNCFMFAFEEHRNWFILNYAEHLEKPT